MKKGIYQKRVVRFMECVKEELERVYFANRMKNDRIIVSIDVGELFFTHSDKLAILKWGDKKAAEVWGELYKFTIRNSGGSYSKTLLTIPSPFCIYNKYSCTRCSYKKEHGSCEYVTRDFYDETYNDFSMLRHIFLGLGVCGEGVISKIFCKNLILQISEEH